MLIKPGFYAFWDGTKHRIFALCKSKENSTIKRVFKKNETGEWEKVFEGTSKERLEFIKYQSRLAAKAERRDMIGAMCGTSYAAAMRDMGMKP